MIMKIPKPLLTLGLVFFLAVGTGHSTRLIVQMKVSVSRALAGHADVEVSGVPASGVTVELCSSDWKTVVASTKTDEKGYFSLEKPATGKLFYLRLSAPGMDTYQLRVRIKKHAAHDLAIHLIVAT
jgi:5-hydroxyisourate hydrolase-like protein (transthyretin family)